jgi:hypothetical protein
VHQVIGAMARALVGGLGAMAQEVPVTPSVAPTAHAARQPVARCSPGSGSAAAPVWGTPRQRDEALR